MKIGVVKSEIYVWVQRGWWVAPHLIRLELNGQFLCILGGPVMTIKNDSWLSQGRTLIRQIMIERLRVINKKKK